MDVVVAIDAQDFFHHIAFAGDVDHVCRRGDDCTAVSYQQQPRLRGVLPANGRSFSDPVLDPNGREDMDKSRRVVFKFRLTDEQMIQQLKDILERE